MTRAIRTSIHGSRLGFDPDDFLSQATNGLPGIIYKGWTVATLPAASVVGGGAKAFVTDSNQTLIAGIGTTAAGGGTSSVPVFSDGTNWIIG